MTSPSSDERRDATDHRAADGAPPRPTWRASRVVLGVLMITVGVIGCLLPVIPGIPFLIAGVALLGPRHWLVRPFAERLERWRRR